jgi:hypothetical protein
LELIDVIPAKAAESKLAEAQAEAEKWKITSDAHCSLDKVALGAEQIKHRDDADNALYNAVLTPSPPQEQHDLATFTEAFLDAAVEQDRREREQPRYTGHRVEIEFDGNGLEPGLRLLHPETGCDPGEEGRPGTCGLDGWLENADEPEGMLRGKLTIPVTYELDANQPLFHLLAVPQPNTPTKEGDAHE